MEPDYPLIALGDVSTTNIYGRRLTDWSALPVEGPFRLDLRELPPADRRRVGTKLAANAKQYASWNGLRVSRQAHPQWEEVCFTFRKDDGS